MHDSQHGQARSPLVTDAQLRFAGCRSLRPVSHSLPTSIHACNRQQHQRKDSTGALGALGHRLAHTPASTWLLISSVQPLLYPHATASRTACTATSAGRAPGGVPSRGLASTPCSAWLTSPRPSAAKYGDVARQPHPAPVSTRARAPDCAATRAAPAACLASAGSCLTALAAAAAAKPATKLAAIAKDGYV